MLEEAEDKAARAAVEGRAVISSLPTPYNDGEDWIILPGFVDPPEPPNGHKVEVKRDTFLGVVEAYRFVPVAQHQPLIVIETPYSGDMEGNIAYARACLLDSLRRGEAPIASHLLHTQVLDDMQPDERSLGIEAGLAWYRVATKCVVYTDRGISGGMKMGIDRAMQHDVAVEYRSIENRAAA
jgi:hypothetical protein